MARQTMMTMRIPARPGRPSRADRPARRATNNGRRTADGKRGFTLVELLVVIVILAILIALLLPAINGAIRTSRNAAVSAEINQLAQALEQFKSTYGMYPPSRVYLQEKGDYSIVNGAGSGSLPLFTDTSNYYDPTSPGGSNDISVAQLASRTLAAFRRIWPRVQLSTSGTVFPPGTNNPWYDFNGNGQPDTTPYVLHGHECLTFFLGGIPLRDTTTNTFSMTGFGKDPTNPFSNSIASDPRFGGKPNHMYNANRQPPIYEFAGSRLHLDPSSPLNEPAKANQFPIPGIPGYLDSLNNTPPEAISGLGPVNFFAYFSAYGNGNYDPNDVNITEVDQNTTPVGLQYQVTNPVYGSTATPVVIASPGPNPYTSTFTAPTPNATHLTVTFQKPQTFQLISSGADGLYGVGGQYVPPTQSSSAQQLPVDGHNVVNTTDGSVRQREYDNLTNFKQGTLQ